MAQVKTPTAFLFRWNGRTGAAQGAQISYFHYTTDANGDEVPGSAFESSPQEVSVSGSAGVPLADIVGLINTDALASAAQVVQLTTDLATANSTITSLQAQLDAINGPAAISIKFVRIALDKLALADAIAKAIELTIATLEAAKDENSKRVYSWWYDVGSMNFVEPEWALIVAEMDKAAMWGDSSETALIDLARQISLG
jgi:hypothetical protein